MKNPHGVEPSRYYCESIICPSNYGPSFGFLSDYFGTILEEHGMIVTSYCNLDDRNQIDLYCVWHPKYRNSLFVNTAGPDETNWFTVLDYEVFTHN